MSGTGDIAAPVIMTRDNRHIPATGGSFKKTIIYVCPSCGDMFAHRCICPGCGRRTERIKEGR